MTASEVERARRWLPSGVAGAVAAWPIWNLPHRLVAPVLLTEVAAVLVVGLGVLGHGAPRADEWQRGVLLLVLGVLHAEIARDVERTRRRLTGDDLHVDLASVWIMAGCLVLSPGYAAIAGCLLHCYVWRRSAFPRAPLYRQVFNTATVALAVVAAGASVSYLDSAFGIGVLDGATSAVVAVTVFLTLNTALVGGAIAVGSPGTSANEILGQWDENLLELATLCLGALAAVALLVSPWLPLLLLPPLLVLHRAVLVRQLEEKASTDGKTGLLNAAAWHTRAEKELRRARRRDVPRGVLVVDLDHFKGVNDRHGHLAGDRVLAAVADTLRAEVRERDLVGRFGGEEFVVLLAGASAGDADTAELVAVAERIRQRIAVLRVEIPTADGPLTVAGLTASVGAAFFPEHGTDLRDLLRVADTALYAAKRGGRNAVRTGTAASPTEAGASR